MNFSLNDRNDKRTDLTTKRKKQTNKYMQWLTQLLPFVVDFTNTNN